MWYESTCFQIWYSNYIKNEPWFDNNVRFCDGSKQRYIENKVKNMSENERNELFKKYNQYRVL